MPEDQDWRRPSLLEFVSVETDRMLCFCFVNTSSKHLTTSLTLYPLHLSHKPDSQTNAPRPPTLNKAFFCSSPIFTSGSTYESNSNQVSQIPSHDLLVDKSTG